MKKTSNRKHLSLWSPNFVKEPLKCSKLAASL